MSMTVQEALDVLQAHLAQAMDTPSERGAPMTQDEILDTLYWLSSANYGAAVHLTRLRNAGVDLHREDGKDLDLWTVEQVRMGNIARTARLDFEKRHGIASDD